MATIPMLMLLYVAGDFTNKVCTHDRNNSHGSATRKA
jgi:hypothetical protein